MYPEKILPLLRTANLVVKELPQEILIYDLQKNKAFCLNETARLIMDQCDGKTSVDEAAGYLHRKLKANVSEEMIWMVVEQLQNADFIEKDYEIPIQTTRVTRRKILQSAAALGIALPMITSLVAPTAAHAQSSCLQIEEECNIEASPSGCCTGLNCIEVETGFGLCLGCVELGNPCSGEGAICCQGVCINVEQGPTGFQCVLPR
jgi:hypothetical protein